MKKKLLFVLAILFGIFSVNAQCSITVNPDTATINCGQSVQLNATALGGAVTYSNDFNLGSAGAGWQTTSGATFTNPCGANPANTTYLWMGSGTAAPRNVQTLPLSITCGGTICFDLRFAVQGGASPCEGPDLATEGVYLQYTTNGGVTWNNIFYFDPNINNSGGSSASPYTQWANYCFTIPAGAISPTTAFRWAQTATSSNLNDHWGIDNVVISGTCANPYSYIWVPSTGLSATNIPNPVASPLTTTTYTVYYTDGVSDTCSATALVNVIQPNVDAGTMQSVCAGTQVTLNGSTTTSMVNQVTFNSSGSVPINDLSTSTSTINVSNLNLTTINIQSISQVCLNITHTWDGDMNIYLQCPGGTQLLLSGANGGSGDNYTNTCFTPTAVNNINGGTAPFTGTFAPEGVGGFGTLNGCNANGTWTLVVQDNAGGDIGTLQNWSIQFNDNVNPDFSWSPNAGMTGDTTFTPSVTPTATTTYTITLTTVPGCSVTDTVTVVVNPLPTPNAGADSTICIGDTTSLNAVGGLSFAWSPSTGLNAANIPNPVAYPTATTDYTVTVSNGTCSGTDTVKVIVNPLPPVDAGTNTTICDGIAVNLQASGATNYTWNPSTGLSDTTVANPVANPTVTTTYYVLGVDANSCAKLDSLTITVNPTPTANAGVDDTICSGSSTTLVGSGGGSYSWNPGTGLNSTGIASPTASPTVTTTYILTVTQGSCIDKDTVTLIVNPLPNVNAGPNQFICGGDSIQLNGSGTNTYAWTPTVSLSNPNISNPVATPTANTTYTLLGTDTNGCSKIDAVSIIVTPQPVVNAGPDDTICNGSSVTLNATSSATSYTWSPSAGLSQTNVANPIASPTATTTYTVMVTQGSCSGIDSVTINVTNAVTVNAGPDLSHCVGDSTQLNVTGGVSYSWSPTFGLTASNIPNPVSFASTTISYIVTATDASGCTGKDTIVVTANALPPVSAGTNSSVCSNDSIQLNATGAVNYFWTPSAGLSDTTIANPTFVPGSTTTFTVTGVDTNGCVKSANVIISVNQAPTITANSTILCPGGVDTLYAFGGVNYTWSPAGTPYGTDAIIVDGSSGSATYLVTGTDANGCSDTTFAYSIVVNALTASPVVSNITCFNACNGSADANVIPNAPGFYNYIWSNGATSGTVSGLCAGVYTFTATTNTGCSVTDTVTLVQPSNALIANATTTPASCFGDSNGSASITQTGGTAGYSYSWSSIGSGSSASNLPAGTYTVIVTDAGSCQDTVIFTVTQPTQLTATLTPFPVGCLGSGSINTTVSGGTPNYNYSWAPSGTGANPSGLGSGTYTMTVTDANGCVLTQTVAVGNNVNLPGANAGNNAILNCGGATTILTGSTGASNATYNWSGPNGFTSTSQNPSVGSGGTYVLTVTDTSNGCTSTDTVVITQATIDASFIASPASGVPPLAVGFVNTSTNATSYSWDFGNGLGSNQPNDSSFYVVPGNYVVTLIVTNQFGCIDSASTVVTVIEPMDIIIPNVFTPNGDGDNDHFYIPNVGLKSLEVLIYDRWGKKLFEINTPDGKWDGGGSPDGTYFYILKAVGTQDEEVSQQGYLLLAR